MTTEHMYYKNPEQKYIDFYYCEEADSNCGCPLLARTHSYFSYSPYPHSNLTYRHFYCRPCANRVRADYKKEEGWNFQLVAHHFLYDD